MKWLERLATRRVLVPLAALLGALLEAVGGPVAGLVQDVLKHFGS